MIAQSIRDHTSDNELSESEAGSEAWALRAREIYSRLEHADKPMPDVLAELIRMLKPAASGWSFDNLQLRYGTLDLQSLFHKHLDSGEQRDVFADYIRFRLLNEGEARQDAMGRLHDAATQEQPVRYANEFEAEMLKALERRAEALQAYVREGSFADAHRARSQANSIALQLQDKATLRRLCDDSRFTQDMDVNTSYHAAGLLEDKWMLLRAVVRLQLYKWAHSIEMPLALFAATIWYLILVYSASRERLRWLRYLPAVLFGVLSVWLLQWLQGLLHYGLSEEQQVTMSHEIFQWVMYVGVPEESVKLIFFLPFLPFLLRHGSTAKAALTAGCVGLGFALDENIGYFLETGGAVAVGRFVTANFMHIALTGIVGGWLYEFLRSRFHKSSEFLMAYLGVVVAHGIYDFSSTESAQILGGEIIGIVILVLAARFYLERLRPEELAMRRRTISSTSVFCIGSALLTGVTIMLAVDQADSMKGAVSALRQTVAIFPVALFYIREFREL